MGLHINANDENKFKSYSVLSTVDALTGAIWLADGWSVVSLCIPQTRQDTNGVSGVTKRQRACNTVCISISVYTNV